MYRPQRLLLFLPFCGASRVTTEPRKGMDPESFQSREAASCECPSTIINVANRRKNSGICPNYGELRALLPPGPARFRACRRISERMATFPRQRTGSTTPP
ncbi:hypothetical protein N431DRAFT_175989 [Stipitochalara longipes BDJ]|nr:hypothetical protein N431DRAFT_175989 [Stipitochalara longipes BDJ]